jgi:hypothetical protein
MANGPIKDAPSATLWGLVLMAAGFGAVALDWYSKRHNGEIYPFAELVAPFVGAIGLAMLVAPDAEDVNAGLTPERTTLRRARRLAAQAVLAIGLLACFADFAAIHGWWP